MPFTRLLRTCSTTCPDWVDLTAPGTSKATALERLRDRLHIPSKATVAVGDGANDIDMFGWAGRSFAMGHAPWAVREAADEVTGTIEQHGAVAVLHSLLPTDIDTASLSRLAAQLATAVHTAPGNGVAVRVWNGPLGGFTCSEVWTLRTERNLDEARSGPGRDRSHHARHRERRQRSRTDVPPG